jgi:UDP-N-acetyl-D-mannosaminuronate dehydrogenase
MNFDVISVIGLGYIGLATACVFASAGASVVGVDIREEIARAERRALGENLHLDLSRRRFQPNSHRGCRLP